MNGNTHPAATETQGCTETLDIPETVRVHCPLVEFRLRQVDKHCPTCPHFKGLADRFPGSSHKFAVRYAVLCAGEPSKRPLLELEA
jgi:hypothetical protein